MLKLCRYCKNRYPESDFGVAATTPNKIYRRHKCRYCYRQTKRLLIARYRKWIEDYKGERQCENCGLSDYRVLDFHHHDELVNKDFEVANFRVGFERLKREIEKCVLLCANCHRIEHYELKLKNGVWRS